MADKIKIEILEDGTISVKTEGVSGVNHHSADEFLTMMKKLAGGECNTEKTRHGHAHVVNGQKMFHNH